MKINKTRILIILTCVLMKSITVVMVCAAIGFAVTWGKIFQEPQELMMSVISWMAIWSSIYINNHFQNKIDQWINPKK